MLLLLPSLRTFTFSLFILTITFSKLSAQEHNEIIDKVNSAVEELDYLHFKTSYLSKYYTDKDTMRIEGETWLFKTRKDKVLGMHIRNKSQYDYGITETFHEASTTWLIQHDKDTIVKYDQNEDHWDGFNGNTKTSWTTETPFTTGIDYNRRQDSISIKQLENDDWLIERFSPDVTEYSIENIKDSWWIDHKTYLPYRYINKWTLKDRVTYNELNIELLDTSKDTVEAGLYKSLPDYPIIDYVKPDPKQFEPLSKGTKAPELNGYFLKDSSTFELSNYLDTSLILIDFWYQSCGPCIKAIPYLDSLQQEFEEKGLLLIEVNSRDHKTEKEELMNFVKQRGGQTEMIVMTDITTEKKVWKCYANPTFYLILNGEIVWMQQGFGNELMPEFRNQIEKYLKEM